MAKRKGQNMRTQHWIKAGMAAICIGVVSISPDAVLSAGASTSSISVFPAHLPVDTLCNTKANFQVLVTGTNNHGFEQKLVFNKWNITVSRGNSKGFPKNCSVKVVAKVNGQSHGLTGSQVSVSIGETPVGSFAIGQDNQSRTVTSTTKLDNSGNGGFLQTNAPIFSVSGINGISSVTGQICIHSTRVSYSSNICSNVANFDPYTHL